MQNGMADVGRRDQTRKEPVHVNFGEWDIDEIQICEMGSGGPEGEYIAVARESLA